MNKNVQWYLDYEDDCAKSYNRDRYRHPEWAQFDLRSAQWARRMIEKYYEFSID